MQTYKELKPVTVINKTLLYFTLYFSQIIIHTLCAKAASKIIVYS
jgi:hypothetical protein